MTAFYDPLAAEAARGHLTAEDEYRQYLSDLQIVARKPEGARLICRLLDELGAFDPVWSAKNPNLARSAVLHDFGQDILSDLAVAADDVHDDIQRMMRIRRKAAGVLRIDED